MGTRGTWGYVVDGMARMAYCQFDSYPSRLGEDILAHARWVATSPDYSERAIRDLRMVDYSTPPTPEDIEHCRPWTDLRVGERQASDWYCLLRKTQGDPVAVLAAGLLLGAGDFPANSLFCEYGYVIDLDSHRFEYYEGFQRAQHTEGRFAAMAVPAYRHDGYWPIRLMRSWPLDALPDSLDGIDDVPAEVPEGPAVVTE